jgi:hypothetical protein
LILEGKKIVETRKYALPKKFLGKELILMETPGKNGNFKSRIAGIIRFTRCFEYKTKNEFYGDKERHCVTRDSIWAWTEGKKWGWEVEVIKITSPPLVFEGKKGIVYTKDVSI